MIAGNLLLVGLILGFGAASLIVFFFALFLGAFDDPEETARTLFDDRDMLIYRPWESEDQLETRRQEHGELVGSQKGEWGGAR